MGNSSALIGGITVVGLEFGDICQTYSMWYEDVVFGLYSINTCMSETSKKEKKKKKKAITY